MRKAGGIIALVAGVFGTLAAIVTLFFGGFAAALESEGAETVIGLGWAGLGFAFLTIVLAAVALAVPSRFVGSMLIVSAIAGGIFGGTLVAVCMVLTLIGGILVLVGIGQESRETNQGEKIDA